MVVSGLVVLHLIYVKGSLHPEGVSRGTGHHAIVHALPSGALEDNIVLFDDLGLVRWLK